MAGASPFHDMPLDDFRSAGAGGDDPSMARVAPTNAEVAQVARFQSLDVMTSVERAALGEAGGPQRSAADAPLLMHDPQQPDLAERAAAAANAARYGGDPELDAVSPVKMVGGATMLAMVEPAVLTAFERPRPVVHAAAAGSRVDPEEEARRIIANARDSARAMLAQAKEVIAAERAQAIRDGHAEGYAQGTADADAETAGLVATCERIGIHVMEERERVLGEQEADTVELAIAIAQRIVAATIDVTPEIVVESCRSAMRKAFQRESMQVLAHPDDLARLRDAGPQLAAELGGVEHLDFLEERRLDRGSIIVRTPAGEIDATIAGKSARIEQALREGIEAQRAERRAAG